MTTTDPGVAPQPARWHVRRATLEDLPQLRKLWTDERLPVSELEKRFTEFQVALGNSGTIAGAIGLQVSNLHGLVHSEAFANPAEAAQIRPVLWGRIRTVAKNHGLLRLWALPTTSFYREQGMTEIDDTLRAKLPAGFGSPLADWLTLKLRDEPPNAISLEKEFELFAMSQKGNTEKVMKQAQVFKIFAYLLLAAALAGVAFAVIFAFRHSSRRRR